MAQLYELYPDVDIFNLTDVQIAEVMGLTIANEICNRIDLQLGQTYEKLKYDPLLIQERRSDIREWVGAEVRVVLENKLQKYRTEKLGSVYSLVCLRGIFRMIKVMCAKAELIPAQVPADGRVFSYFKGAKRAGVGTIANRWHGALKRSGFRPSTEIWDFVQFCLAVCSADLSSPRRTSADGWTRNIQLTVGLCDPDKWLPLKSDLEDMLKVLTGDYWLLNFNNAGMEPPQGDGAFLSNDCVSLLSGGLDSLIGGIDLVAKGQNLYLFLSSHIKIQSDRGHTRLC